jgi:His/Glu/Gln/Arg/opine family amino acid ABC transporter permease subunit
MTKWAAVWGSLGYLMKGALATVELSFTVIVIGTALGLIGGLLRVMPQPRLQRMVGIVVEGVRAVPLLLQMFFIFFGLPALGIEMPVFLSAVLAMTLWMAVNSTEVFRGAVQSIAPGQSEAAYSTGLGYWQTMRFVIVPQAVRRMLPPFVGLCTILIKDSSLAAIIGVFEETIERTFASVELYLFAAAVYFVICFPLTSLSRRLEARLSTHGLGAVAAGR